ncbi:hypothetical protein F5Y08DRAFT_343346 [Xylaria arbuscula]|nr:hypothetical protein F5Y08DRAFT_343346 [Xylaria arbuscula]
MGRLYTKSWGLGDGIHDPPDQIKSLSSRLHFVKSLIDNTGEDHIAEQIFILTGYYAKNPTEYLSLWEPENDDEVARPPARFIKDELAPFAFELDWLHDFCLEHAQFFFPPNLLYRKTRTKWWLWVLEVGDYHRIERVCYGKPYWKFSPIRSDGGPGARVATETKWLIRPVDERYADDSGSDSPEGSVDDDNIVNKGPTIIISPPEDETEPQNQGTSEPKSGARPDDEANRKSTLGVPTIMISGPESVPEPQAKEEPRIAVQHCEDVKSDKGGALKITQVFELPYSLVQAAKVQLPSSSVESESGASHYNNGESGGGSTSFATQAEFEGDAKPDSDDDDDESEGGAKIHDELEPGGERGPDDTDDSEGGAPLHDTVESKGKGRLYEKVETKGEAIKVEPSGGVMPEDKVESESETKVDDTDDSKGGAILHDIVESESKVRPGDVESKGEVRLDDTDDSEGGAPLYDTVESKGKGILHEKVEPSGEVRLDDKVESESETKVDDTDDDSEGGAKLYDTVESKGKARLYEAVGSESEIRSDNTDDSEGGAKLHEEVELGGETKVDDTDDPDSEGGARLDDEVRPGSETRPDDEDDSDPEVGAIVHDTVEPVSRAKSPLKKSPRMFFRTRMGVRNAVRNMGSPDRRPARNVASFFWGGGDEADSDTVDDDDDDDVD